MVESDLIDNELFVVLIPGGEVLSLAQKIQKRISNYYNIYKEDAYPQIHLTIDKVKFKDKEKSLKIIDKVVKKLEQPIKIEINQFSCYYLSSNKFLVLKVEETDSLKDFARKLHFKLSEKNLSVIDDYDNWEYHITLISNIFAENPVSNKDFNKLCYIFNGQKNSCKDYATYLEIWKPTLDPEKKVVQNYKL